MTGTGIDQVAQQLLQYAHDGNWRLLVAMALSGVIWLLRTYIFGPTVQSWRYVGQLASWFRSDRGGVVLTLAVGVLGGIVTALGANASLTLNLVLTGIVNGLLASGFFTALKHVFGSSGASTSGGSSSTSPVLPTSGGSSTIPIVAVLLSASLLLQGCACLKPENANKEQCVVEQHEINCATQDVQQMAPQLLPLVAWLFSGATGPFDSSSIVAALEQIGFKFVGCSATQLEQDFSTDPAGTEARLVAASPSIFKASSSSGAGGPSLSTAYHQRYQQWRAKHMDVRFCFRVDGRNVCR